MADFVYPYNFVSRDNPPKELLPFKPHHRFDGLTGRIRYKIKNISPLFIPDPEGTTVYKIGSKEADTHHVMDFFNVKDRLCIPPTSIKGMLRSVFEAVTNSTFGVIDLDDVRYSYRKAKDFRNYVGIYQNGQIIPNNSRANPIPIHETVIRNYIDVNERDGNAKKKYPLKNDMKVYYRMENGSVSEFGPVAIFKSAENASLKEIIEKHSSHLIPPTTAQKLCPATRLFGWTPESDEAKEQGVAGRVRFSPAWGNKTLKDTVLVPLKILGGPRPKYYPFYLKPVNPSESSKSAYYTLNADPPFSATRGKIRGQKFYLHHPRACKKGIEPTDYIKKETDADNPAFTNQNSTCAVLPAGDTLFEGYIEFESLDAYELGGILWCMTLSDNPKVSSPNHAHKLGKGKGIGMGSVQFEITDIEIFNPQDNWFSLDDNIPIDLQKMSVSSVDGIDFIQKFKKWLSNGNSFDKLPNIKELLLILSKDLVRDKKIMYRSPNDKHDEGFNYFMEQRKKRVVNAKNNELNQEEPLGTPEELKNGKTQKGDYDGGGFQKKPFYQSKGKPTKRW